MRSRSRIRSMAVIAAGALFAPGTSGAVDEVDGPASAGMPSVVDERPDLRESLTATNLLRVRRLAPTWTNARMDVLTRSGTVVSGRFRGLGDASLLVIPADGDPHRVPVRDLARITLKRKSADLALVGALALGVGGLAGGVGALGTDTDGQGTAALAAGGVVIGAIIAWKTVYRDRVITFE